MKAIFTGRSRGGGRGEQVERGTTLVELMIAVALFVIISGAAFNLFSRQQSASTGLNGQVGLNLALRNATSLLQMDLANAGYGFYQNINIANGALGVTIVNNVVPTGSSCYTSSTSTYGANCFDQLNIIAIDSTYPTVHPTNSTAGTGATAWSYTNSTASNGNCNCAYALAPTGLTLAQTAAYYKTGDQLLFIKADGSQFSTVVLTQPASVVGATVQFKFNPTASNGSNTLATDPLNISACSGTTPCPPATVTSSPLTNQFNNSDWILKLAPITYQVNSSNPSDPILTRTQGGVTATVMEQIVGFKVGATIFNSVLNDFNNPYYVYDASKYTTQSTNDGAYNFSLLRSVRVSLIGRTVPATTSNYVYRNTFDGGPYQVQGTAVVVNPRNMNF